MENDFNVLNPTKDNIEFAFKNLLFYVSASSQLKMYSEYKESFLDIQRKINDILAIYINDENLISINENILQDMKYDLIDLDTETKNLDSYFAEWSLLWLEAIISLRTSEIKRGGRKNG